MSCAFCGEPFSKKRPRSKEHAWAQWLAQYLPNPVEKFRHIVSSPTGEVKATWTDKDLAVISKQICNPCNTGWMNDLENAARPYLVTLMKGRGRTLYREAQTVLGAWAVKTALALQLAIPDAVRIPAEHYRAIYELKTKPPPKILIWLGAYEGWRHLWVSPHHLTLNFRDGSGRDAYETTLVVGHAVFQVFGHLNEDEVTWERAARADVATQIWPIRKDVQFPPPAILTEATLKTFSLPPTGNAA